MSDASDGQAMHATHAATRLAMRARFVGANDTLGIGLEGRERDSPCHQASKVESSTAACGRCP